MHIEQYTYYEKMKVTSSSGILKTNPNGSYLLLFGKNYKVFRLHAINSSYFEISTSLF